MTRATECSNREAMAEGAATGGWVEDTQAAATQVAGMGAAEGVRVA